MKYLRIAGFSLVELLVVILIMGTIGSVVIACFMGGMRAYERVHDFGREEADIYIAFELMERDLKNAVSLSGEVFVGDGTLMQFPSMAAVADMQGAGGGVNKVRYWADPQGGVLRSSDEFGESVSYSGGEESIVSGNVRMWLEYRGDGEDGGADWSDVWQSVSNIPQQVHISFQVGGDGDGGVLFERVIILPNAGI